MMSQEQIRDRFPHFIEVATNKGLSLEVSQWVQNNKIPYSIEFCAIPYMMCMRFQEAQYGVRVREFLISRGIPIQSLSQELVMTDYKYFITVAAENEYTFMEWLRANQLDYKVNTNGDYVRFFFNHHQISLRAHAFANVEKIRYY